jgi:hypothetical protein
MKSIAQKQASLQNLRRAGGTLLALLLLILAIHPAAPAAAQSGEYELSWWTIDGGGGSPSSGTGGAEYSLSGTVGQPDAGRWSQSGASPYALSGGFWFTGATVADYEVFLPVIVRGGS